MNCTKMQIEFKPLHAPPSLHALRSLWKTICYQIDIKPKSPFIRIYICMYKSKK